MSVGTTTLAMQAALDRLAGGDPKAKDELVDKALERLLAVARRLLRSFGGEKRVEMWTSDLLGEAYLKLHKALDDVKPSSVGQFIGLAKLQMRRVLLDKVRRARAAPGDIDLSNLDVADRKSDERQLELAIDLLGALEELPENLGTVVWCRLEGHTFPEIGEQMGVHKDTAERYWHQACVKLGQRLAPFLRDA